MKRLRKFFTPHAASQPVILVSGLPRSGTSMLMKMLEAGGIPVLTDHIRAADPDNPQGYYEWERAKGLRQGDTDWLSAAQGKAVKVISALLESLPDEYTYRVLFMRRSMAEILASQRQMLIHRKEDPDKVPDDEMARLYEGHLAKVTAWLQQKSNFEVLYLDYAALLRDPRSPIDQMQTFLQQSLDTAAMAAVVDPSLYRQRDSAG